MTGEYRHGLRKDFGGELKSGCHSEFAKRAIKSPQGELAGFGIIHLYVAWRGGEARLSGGTDVSRHGENYT